ncbi:AI-2E family transporter [Salimicrobium halophilum]|uniref:Predicted PurR-regulated permease PerM n=1 Tax=Salimicrobium halophilum TaxID=86666 RepID=A0A1G8TXJ7_9BACI|nr:AI-2E family transporter [Salimicrobium halophilum]SDJ46219.1 Predicted PurR-regulated permease PerM [Salimicrobium halophilum]
MTSRDRVRNLWYDKPAFPYTVWALAGVAIIYLLGRMDVFQPFLTAFWTLFYPVLITGFLFYLLRPLTRGLSRKTGIPLSVSVLLVFTVVGGIMYGGIRLIISRFNNGIGSISQLPDKMKSMSDQLEEKLNSSSFASGFEFEISKYYNSLSQQITGHFGQIFSTVTEAATTLFVIPIILFFFLKDGRKMIPYVMRLVPEKKKEGTIDVMRKMDRTISAYITGQAIVAFVDGTLMYIAYLIIGLEYSLLLGVFLMCMSIVPFFGPLIGVVPAVIIGFMNGPFVAAQVLIALLIVQQLEGNLVAPYVLGNRLDVHPVTIIFLLLVAMPLAGFIGMVVAVPVYALIKTLTKEVMEQKRTEGALDSS